MQGIGLSGLRPASQDAYQVRAVLRALELLDCFTPREAELNLMQLAEQSGLCSSTAFRLLQTLAARGYVEHDPQSGRYRLGMACVRLGEVAGSHLDFPGRLRPLLVGLRDRFREAVHLAVLDPHRMQVVYLEKLDGLLPIGMMSSRVGARAPAHCTGVGKSLLAFLDPADVAAHYRQQPPQAYTPRTIADLDRLAEHLAEVRRQGYAVDNVEHEPDVKCVAVPVRNHTGAVVCSISVSGPEARIDGHLAGGRLVEDMLGLGQEASRRLGHIGGA